MTDHAIWWHVYPLGACGAPRRAADDTAAEHQRHRLRRMDAWLDYVIELGCSGLLLGPVFAATSHGYDTVDYFRLDPRLGDDSDWDHFVTEAHRRGLLLMLDGVFNHVGVDHELVPAAITEGAGMVRTVDGRHQGWEGHDDLAELDHQDPRVADLVVEVMTYWLAQGADGWRLDVAYAVPSAFWSQVLGRVREQYPQAFFLGEVIHGDYSAVAQAGGLDAVTQYELWKAIWSSLSDRNLWELAWALQRHQDFCDVTTMQTFVGNHDVTRIASRVGDGGAAIAAVILLTLPGMPSIYYGDEQAFRGEKGNGWEADEALRPALPEDPSGLDPAGWWLYRLHQELIALRRRHSWIATGRVAVQDRNNTSLRYAVTAPGHHLVVDIDITDRPQATLTVDGHREVTWPR
ncbi:alpha-amylase family protein [Austwickia sp. TVS 96-490-7B]|uniref:alpha-amylase family protein n=1 Tax=Austwickia sp. TVS 96-490-7B TaxID=2830843 RepID=UPI002102554B|nr:alpha-amylase family protein [Austwickia sp. TVS 96-490-7B]